MTKQSYETEQLTRSQILALDIATHCGFYSVHEHGTWNFEESLRRNNNKQHSAFRQTLIDFITKHGIRKIVAEDVNAGAARGGFKASVKLSEFRGILMEVCDTLDLSEPAFVNVVTVKKFATGDGHADKTKMIEACKTRWGATPVDDNDADATHIFYYYCRTFNIKAE